MKRNLLTYKFRNSNQQPSKWLPETICNEVECIDSLHAHHLNYPHRLAELVYENETRKNLSFLSEGLIKTYPTQKFIAYMKRSFQSIVPAELQKLRFSDLNSFDSDDQLLSDFVSTSEEQDGISPLLSFLVPFRKDRNFKSLLDKIINKSYVFGYDFSSLKKWDHDLIPEIDIFIVQFEARYPSWKFDLADTLLHVSPMSNLKKIAKRGLVPRAQSKEFEYRDRIYLFNKCKKDMIISYADYKVKAGDFDPNEGFCVFKIRKKNLVNDPLYKCAKLDLFIDMSFHEETSVDIEAVFTYNNIGLHLLDDDCLLFKNIEDETPMVKKFKQTYKHETEDT